MIKLKITAFFAAMGLCASFSAYAVINAIPLNITVDPEDLFYSGSLTCPTCTTTTSLSETVTGDVDAVFNVALNSNGSSVQRDTMADGSTMILPMFGQDSVTITSITGNGTIVADDNPVLEANGIGTGVNNYLFYDSTKNIVNSLPITYTQDTTIHIAKMKTVTGDDECDTRDIHGECVEAYYTVTILMANPSAGAANTIRPSITATTKELITIDELNPSNMKCISNADFVAPNSSEYAAITRRYVHNSLIYRLWGNGVEDYSSEGGRAYGAHLVSPSYGGTIETQRLDDLSRMQACAADRNSAEWKKAFAAMVSYGLDVYHVKYTDLPALGRYFGTGAGQWPMTFPAAAWSVAMLDNSSKFDSYRANIASASTESPSVKRVRPQLTGSIFAGPNGSVWGNERTASPAYATCWDDYFESGGWPGAPWVFDAVGSKSQVWPDREIDGPCSSPGSSYFSIDSPIQQANVLLACHTVGLSELINYDSLFEYSDRLESTGRRVTPDSCAPVDPIEGAAGINGCDVWSTRNVTFPTTKETLQSLSNCLKYGETWGQDPAGDGSQCIANNSGGNTGQNGRFNIDATYTPNATYISYPWLDNYSTLRGTSAACRGITL